MTTLSKVWPLYARAIEKAENKLDAHFVIYAAQFVAGFYISMAHLEAWDSSATVSEAQIVESISSYDFSQYNPVSIQLLNR